jgi:adenine/guanine phosphoribosyltransferase-like PRPP-binding protein
VTLHKAFRAHRNATLLLACATAALGALVGAAAGGWLPALAVAAITGSGVLVSGRLVRSPYRATSRR